MDVSRELRTLRHRQADLVARRDHRPGTTIMQGPVRAVQVFAQAAVPTTVPRYFACHPLVTGGVEGEGQALVATPDTAQVLYVAVLGPRVPVAGDRLIARLVGPRWVADSGKSTSAPPGGCSGSGVPSVLTGDVYQGSRSGFLMPLLTGITLSYGPPPSTPPVYTADIDPAGQCFAPRLITMPPSAWFSPAIPDPNWAGGNYYVWLYINSCSPAINYLFNRPGATLPDPSGGGGTVPANWIRADNFGASKAITTLPFAQPISWVTWGPFDCHQALTSDSKIHLGGSGSLIPVDSTNSIGKFT
jgi:hypothetical protein